MSIALLFEYTAPVMVALWARFVLHEKVRNRMWVALVLALSGLGLVAQVWAGATLDGIGVAAALIAGLALASHYLLGEHSTSSRDPLSTTCWAFVFASVFWSLVQPWWSFPVGAFEGSAPLLGNLTQHSLPLWVLAGWMVLFGTVAGVPAHPERTAPPTSYASRRGINAGAGAGWPGGGGLAR